MTAYYERGGITIHHGDFREIMPTLEVGSVAAIITDPPYPKEYLSLWDALGEHSARLLPRGGSLLSLVPHYALPYVLTTVGAHLKYRWLMAMWQQEEGNHPRMAMGIEVCFKPLVWWVQGAWPSGRGFIKDGFKSRISTKRAKLHKWEQTTSWARHCLKLVPKGGVVLDPMLGSGTLLAVAETMGFPAIGIDNDEEACEIAARRLAQDILPLQVAP